MHSKARLILSVLLVLLVAGWAAAQADIVIYTGGTDLPQVGKLPVATAGDIKVNGALVMKIPGNGGGLPLDVRAEIVDTRMTEILSAGLVGPVRVGDVRGKPTIWVGDYRLITVYPEDAAAVGTDMKSLACAWAVTVSQTLWRCSPAVGPSADELSVKHAPPA
jgi:hypothetical protein